MKYEPKGLKATICEANGEIYTDSRVCVNCGEEAELVQGYRPNDIRLEQFNCPHCNPTFVTTEYGRFIRYGVLKPLPEYFGRY